MSDPHLRLTRLLSESPPVLSPDLLRRFVARHFEKRDRCLNLWRKHGGMPLYLFDETALLSRAAEFRAAFDARLPACGFYYAMKSNNHPFIAQSLATAGFGLDVSSGLELQLALDTAAEHIVFSGPGKLDRELIQAVAHADRVTVLIDSFGELDRLSAAAATGGARVRAGVRVNPPGPHGWRKFGIGLDRLRAFWETAARRPGVQLQGIQFHTSWNMTSTAQIETITALGRELETWPAELTRTMSFLDIGGGYWPPAGEWLLPEATDGGHIRQLLDGVAPDRSAHFCNPAISIDEAAANLAQAIRQAIFPVTRCRICFEPGRWLSNEAMHILISVVDKKETDLVITDAGTNAIGWERFERDYAPILNLSQPGLSEQPCHILGSLCTPHDVWGYNYFGGGIDRGDILLIPDQGAYTYSLRQHFIKPIPATARM
ncbi:MAG: alanine racemase [Lentisphaeria bacterium]|nr:alanine racemase [Lentisphaeria bacterium]